MSKRYINRGEKTQYHIDGNHTLIIDKSIFENAIKCRERRGRFVYDDNLLTKEESAGKEK